MWSSLFLNLLLIHIMPMITQNEPFFIERLIQFHIAMQSTPKSQRIKPFSFSEPTILPICSEMCLVIVHNRVIVQGIKHTMLVEVLTVVFIALFYLYLYMWSYPSSKIFGYKLLARLHWGVVSYNLVFAIIKDNVNQTMSHWI